MKRINRVAISLITILIVYLISQGDVSNKVVDKTPEQINTYTIVRGKLIVYGESNSAPIKVKIR